MRNSTFNSSLKKICFISLLIPTVAFSTICPSTQYEENLNCTAQEAVFYNVGSGKTKAHHILVGPNRSFSVLRSSREDMPYSAHIVGQNLSSYGKEAAKKTFERIENKFQVSCHEIRCLGIATAWAREACNAEDFLVDVYSDHGIMIKILTQEEEAIFSYEVLYKKVNKPESLVMLDIGGGSLQVVLPNINAEPSILGLAYGGEKFRVNTMPCLQENYPSSEMETRFLTPAELDIARSCQPYLDISNLNLDDKDRLALAQGHLELYGIGGLINTAVKGMLREGQTFVTLDDLLQLQENLNEMTVEEATKKYPRVPVIKGNNFNLLLLEAVMKGLGVTKIIFADSYFGEEDLALAVFSRLHN